MSTMTGKDSRRPYKSSTGGAVTRKRNDTSLTPDERRKANAECQRRRRANMTLEERRAHRAPNGTTYVYDVDDGAAEVGEHTAREIAKILGGAERSIYHKPRGFLDYNPTDAGTLLLIERVNVVLNEYREHWPLMIRQVLYRLMDQHGYAKHDIDRKLYEVCDRMRRARMIPMDAIRDDGGAQELPFCWDDADDFIVNTRLSAEQARLDRQEGQPKRLILYCEAVGMVPQLAKVADEYGVPVLSSGGADSITEKFQVASNYDNAEVLHIGDLDPHGIHMFIALAEDVAAFAKERGNEIDFTRLAVTPKQITKLRLPTSPVVIQYNENGKRTTPAYPHDFTCQAEAIAPDELARIVRKAIKDRLDRDAYQAVLDREDELHAELAERLGE